MKRLPLALILLLISCATSQNGPQSQEADLSGVTRAFAIAEAVVTELAISGEIGDIAGFNDTIMEIRTALDIAETLLGDPGDDFDAQITRAIVLTARLVLRHAGATPSPDTGLADAKEMRRIADEAWDVFFAQ